MDARAIISTAVHFLNEAQSQAPKAPNKALLHALKVWSNFATENELGDHDRTKGIATIKRFANVSLNAKEVKALYY